MIHKEPNILITVWTYTYTGVQRPETTNQNAYCLLFSSYFKKKNQKWYKYVISITV